jgi:hypothetical protein
VADVLGHDQHHRPGPPRRRHHEGAADEFRDALRALDAQQFLAGRAQDLGLVGLLRHVLPGMGAVRIADDRDDRAAGIQRLDEPGDEVRRPRPERRVAQAHPPAHLGVGIGGEDAAALVVDQRVLEAEPRTAS